MAGKVRLALAAPEPDWGHATLAVTERGLSTGPLRCGERAFEIVFDLHAHRLEVLGDAARPALALRDGLSCADVYRGLSGALGELGVRVAIRAEPFGLEGPPFARDTAPRRYDADAAGSFARVLRSTRDALLALGGDGGPVGLHWHGLDLARTHRRPAAAVTLGLRCGGGPGAPAPAFYGSVDPAPEGLSRAPLDGEGARWRAGGGRPEAVAPYEAVRRAGDPARALIAFYASVLRAAG